MDVARLPLLGHGGLMEALARIPDPRWRSGMRFPAGALLSAALCATLAGQRSFKAIWQWTASQPASVRLALGFRNATPPSEKAIRTFLQRVNSEKMAAIVGEWFRTQLTSFSAVALDGKTLRGSRQEAQQSTTQTVSAVTHGQAITLGQVIVDNGNEIGAVQKLIAALDVTGMVITLDALHTQKDTASLIVNVKRADYVMTVKGNQPSLMAEIQNAPLRAFSPCL